MKNLNYMSVAEDAVSKIKQGAFLTVKAADALNTMTIGWPLSDHLAKAGHDGGRAFNPLHLWYYRKGFRLYSYSTLRRYGKATLFADRNRVGCG